MNLLSIFRSPEVRAGGHSPVRFVPASSFLNVSVEGAGNIGELTSVLSADFTIEARP